MPEGDRERRQKDVDSVDRLFAAMRTHGQMDPPPALRSRLARLSEVRLKPARNRWPLSRGRLGRTFGLATALAALVGGAVFIGYYIHRQNRFTSGKAIASSSTPRTGTITPKRESSVSVPTASPVSRNRARLRTTSGGTGNLILALPYSNTAIATGTGAAIPISISQNQLVAMGFPGQPTVSDRRVTASLILGDDGLPRAIAVPFMPGMTRGTE